jgi:hypothetical protein
MSHPLHVRRGAGRRSGLRWRVRRVGERERKRKVWKQKEEIRQRERQGLEETGRESVRKIMEGEKLVVSV